MIVLEIGNRLESTRHSRPPLLDRDAAAGRGVDTCASAAAASAPASGSAGFSGGTAPRAKYTSSFGNPSKVDSGRPKFFASSGLGVWPIQSVMLNVPNSEK